MMLRTHLPELLALEWQIQQVNDTTARLRLHNELNTGLVSILFWGVEPIGNTSITDADASITDWFSYFLNHMDSVLFAVSESVSAKYLDDTHHTSSTD